MIAEYDRQINSFFDELASSSLETIRIVSCQNYSEINPAAAARKLNFFLVPVRNSEKLFGLNKQIMAVGESDRLANSDAVVFSLENVFYTGRIYKESEWFVKESLSGKKIPAEFIKYIWKITDYHTPDHYSRNKSFNSINL